MPVKKAPVMQLPAEQQALLMENMPRLRRIAGHIYQKHGWDQDLFTAEDFLNHGLYKMWTAPSWPAAEKELMLAWAYRVINNHAINAVKYNRRNREVTTVYMVEQVYHAIVPHSNEDKVAYLFRMAQQHLRPVVNQVLLGYGLGHSGKQIAAKLGIPHSTVRQHFYTAKNTLKTLMVTA
jgi:RNA polymerase sigma factor (sigma-70 family)